MKIIKTSQAMPEAGEYVLAWQENATTPMRAMWVAQFTRPVGDDADPEWGEYCEEKDEYFCPAGWYEMNRHEEQHWSVDGNVVAWCELPRLDAGAAPAAVAVPTREEIAALRTEHGITSTGRGIKEFEQVDAFVRAVLQRWGAAPALEAPAAPANDEEDAFTKWFQGEQGKPYQGMWEFARAAWMARAAAPQAPAAPVGLPWRTGIPRWTDDRAVRVIAVTAHDDFGGVQVHDIRASDFHTDGDGDGAEVARLCTHWAYRDDIWPRADAAAPAAPAVDAAPLLARHLSEWHEEDGDVSWWAWCGRDWAGEPAWIGRPTDDGWPGYHTHWTAHPAMPAAIAAQAKEGGE